MAGHKGPSAHVTWFPQQQRSRFLLSPHERKTRAFVGTPILANCARRNDRAFTSSLLEIRSGPVVALLAFVNSSGAVPNGQLANMNLENISRRQNSLFEAT